MKQRFLESAYRDDTIALVALVMLSAERAASDGLTMFAGAVFAFIPRLITIYYGGDGRSKAERVRTVVFFCIYFFLAIWSTDLGDSSLQPLVSSFLFGAAFYQLILHLAIRNGFDAATHPKMGARSNIQAISLIFLLYTAMMGMRFMAGESLFESIRQFYVPLMIMVLVSMMRASKRTEAG